jgi:cholesterol transport system auxiliary component
MRVKISTLIATLFLIGCGTTLDVMEHYNLYIKTAPPKSRYQKPIKLKIDMPKFLNRENSLKIFYSYSKMTQDAYLNSQWSDNLSKLLYSQIYKYLDMSNRYKAILGYNSSVYEDEILEITVYDISHHIVDGVSEAIFDVKVARVDRDSNRVINSKRFSYHQQTSSVDAKGFVEATNNLLNRFLRDLSREVL